jgi:hypothetical protein
METKNTSLASKVAIIGLLIISLAFCLACYNSVKETKAICHLTLGIQN